MEQETQEQLKLIEEMIGQTKNNISEGGVFYLLWGVLVLLAAGVNYYLLEFTSYEHHYIAWPVLMGLGGIISMILGFRMEKKSGVKTYVDRAISYLWAGFTVSLILILVTMIKIRPEGAYPVIMILYGLGTFVSGGILKFKPLILGGVASWVISVVALFATFSDQLLLLMAAILLSYIIPGYLLSKSNQHV